MKRNEARTLWWAVGLAFATLALAWTTLFIVAGHHPVQTVPLVNTVPAQEASP